MRTRARRVNTVFVYVSGGWVTPTALISSLIKTFERYLALFSPYLLKVRSPAEGADPSVWVTSRFLLFCPSKSFTSKWNVGRRWAWSRQGGSDRSESVWSCSVRGVKGLRHFKASLSVNSPVCLKLWVTQEPLCQCHPPMTQNTRYYN